MIETNRKKVKWVFFENHYKMKVLLNKNNENHQYLKFLLNEVTIGLIKK